LSDEISINPPSPTAERAPDQPYVPMGSIEPEPEKKCTYEGDDSTAAKAAARDLEKAREAASPPLRPDLAEDGTIKRAYQRLHDGSPVPPNETISLERGATDLKSVRELDIASQLPDPADIAARIDAARGEYFLNQQARQQPDPQLAQTAEQQPAAAEVPQDPAEIRQQQQIDGVHPDVLVALQNEHVRSALQAEINSVEQARAQFANAARDAARVSAAAVLAQAPELANIPSNEIPTALRIMAQTNPQRAAQITDALSRTQALVNASQQAQQQQQAIQAQQFQSWVAEQDAAFDREVTAKESPEMMRKIGENVIALAEEYGVSKQDLTTLYHSQPLMRSAPFQRMMADAARYRMAQREVVNKVDRSVPPVQRPGTSQPRGDGEVTAALNKFLSEPSVANAAKLLQARRASNR
jgi:hypothetical protein